MKKWKSTDLLMLCFVIGLFCIIAFFAARLLGKTRTEKQICQSIVSLENFSYEEEFLKEAEKIRGIHSITPVIKIPVRLRVEDYTMDTVLYGVDLEALQMTAAKTAETEVGSAPVLLLGKESLSGMTDHNGHSLSEKKQKEFLTWFQELEWQYELIPGDGVENLSAMDDGSVRTGGTYADTKETTENDWLPCMVAAVLSEPSDKIFISFSQAANLSGLSLYGMCKGAPAGSVKDILLTVQGEENYQKALLLFER